MRKKVFPRLILALAVAMSAFVLLGALQFARYGGFSRQILGMTVSGRLINGAGNVDSWEIALDGGTGVVFGGLEFRLDEASGANSGNGVPEPGFYFRDGGNVLRPAVPEFLNTTEDSAIFLLNSGAELSFTVFSGPEGLPELRISGSFPAGIGSMDIPFRPRRSTVAWDNTQGRLGVIYDGARYGFRRHSPELTEGRLLLSAERPMASYRMLPGVPEMAVADFAVPEMLAPDSFAAKLAAWIDLSFVRWGTAGREIGTESMTALSAEALRRGIFGAAVAEVEVGFAPRMEGTAAFFDLERRPGFWSREVRVLEPADGQRLDEIAGMLARRNYRGLFAENRPLAFLALYGRDDLIDSFASLAGTLTESDLSLETVPGVLENRADFADLRPRTDNPFDTLTGAALRVLAGALRQSDDQVLAFDGDRAEADIALNIRLGADLIGAPMLDARGDWAWLGRSLLFSVMALEEDGFLPATLVSGHNGLLTASVERLDSARLFTLLSGGEFLPRTWVDEGEGIVARGIARSVGFNHTTYYSDVNVDFPTGRAHYLVLQNVRPFAFLQLHGQTLGRSAGFEGNSVSGWDYFENERTLVVKVRHRTAGERIRIYFTAPPPPPPTAPATPAATPQAETQTDNAGYSSPLPGRTRPPLLQSNPDGD